MIRLLYWLNKNLHSESVSPICSLINRSSASVNSGVSGGTCDEDLLFCWLPINGITFYLSWLKFALWKLCLYLIRKEIILLTIFAILLVSTIARRVFWGLQENIDNLKIDVIVDWYKIVTLRLRQKCYHKRLYLYNFNRIRPPSGSRCCWGSGSFSFRYIKNCWTIAFLFSMK